MLERDRQPQSWRAPPCRSSRRNKFPFGAFANYLTLKAGGLDVRRSGRFTRHDVSRTTVFLSTRKPDANGAMRILLPCRLMSIAKTDSVSSSAESAMTRLVMDSNPSVSRTTRACRRRTTPRARRRRRVLPRWFKVAQVRLNSRLLTQSRRTQRPQ